MREGTGRCNTGREECDCLMKSDVMFHPKSAQLCKQLPRSAVTYLIPQISKE